MMQVEFGEQAEHDKQFRSNSFKITRECPSGALKRHIHVQ